MLLQSLIPRTPERARSDDYDVLVESLHEGRPFRGEHGEPLLTHPPLFPLVLAATYTTADAIGMPRDLTYRWLAALFSSISGTMVFLMVSRWTHPAAAALCATAVVAHPFAMMATTAPLSGIPFTTFLLVAVHQLTIFYRQPHAGRAAFIGLIIGLALLTRAIAILLPVLILGLLLVRALLPADERSARRSTRLVAPITFALLVAATISAWPAWTAREFGEPILLSNRGGRALRDGISLNLKSFREEIPMSPRLQALQRRTQKVYSDLETPSRYLAYLRSELATDPTAVLELFLLKARRAWYGLDSQNARLERIGKIVAVGYLAPTLLALVLLARRVRSRPLPKDTRMIAGTCLGIILLFWGMTTISASLARYMVPAYALFPILWGLAWAALRETKEPASP